MRFSRSPLPMFALLSVALGFAAIDEPSAHAQTEADLSWYEGGESGDDAPVERRYESGDAESGDDHDVGRTTGETGFGLGLSAAYMLPGGDVADHAPLSDFVRGAVRPAIDLHYFLDPHFGFGVYTGIGVGIQSTQFQDWCDIGNVKCRLLLIDAGLFAEYRPLPRAIVVPFVQVNLGYEHYRNKVAGSQSAGGMTVTGVGDVRARGFGAGATVGADFARKSFGFGPFFSAQFGSYRTLTFAANAGGLGSTLGGNNFDKALHYYLLFGLRGRFEMH